MFGIALLGLIVTLAPFSGPAQFGDTAGSARFSVAVSGKAGQAVRLRAVGVPSGYIAAFCTRRVCARFAVSFALPQSGRETIELQLIQNVPGARKPATVTVTAAGARPASIAFSHALR
jgi:hypothetical protein